MRPNIICIVFNILTIIQAQTATTTTSSTIVDNENQNHYQTVTEDVDTDFVITALFSKINLLITEIQQVNKKMDDLKQRVIIQESHTKSIQRNQNSIKIELRDLVQNQSLKGQNALRKMEEDLMIEFENLLKQHRTPNQTAQLKLSHNQTADIKALKQSPNWSVILRRQDGSEEFYRNWNDYKKGFGRSNGEFFIGLEKLHAMTTSGDPQELLVVLEDFDNQTRYARYDDLVVAGEDEKYKLVTLGTYSGNAGDALRLHVNAMFSTHDQDHDVWHLNCAEVFKGAWWFDRCFNSHLNGPYVRPSASGAGSVRGIIWKTFHGPEYSLKFVEMMIRPKI